MQKWMPAGPLAPDRTHNVGGAMLLTKEECVEVMTPSYWGPEEPFDE
jgi:hypothetical protein